MSDSVSSHDRDKARRIEKEKARLLQKTKYDGTRARKKLMIYGGSLVAIILVVFGIMQYQRYVGSQPGKFDVYAQCLSDNGAYMYGTEWCPHCQNQKAMFGNSFRLVNYIDCDRSAAACQNAGVTSYPTWIFEDGSRASGTQTFATLSDKTGCTP